MHGDVADRVAGCQIHLLRVPSHTKVQGEHSSSSREFSTDILMHADDAACVCSTIYQEQGNAAP